MYVSHVALSNFRSYSHVVLAFEPGVTTFIGENGQGKTNIVEAVGYLATLGSHRVSSDSALIKQGESAAVIQARVMHGDRPTTVEVEIFAGRANRARINRAQVRPPEILGHLRAVVFAPEDLRLISGEPQERRNFLDDIMIQLRPRLAGVKAEYEKVLRQRAAVLKSAGAAKRRGLPVDMTALDVWDVQAAQLGSQIIAARTSIIAGLRPYVMEYYRAVSGGQGAARIDYAANIGADYWRLPSAEELCVSGDEEKSLDNEFTHKVDEIEQELCDVELTEVRILESMVKRRAQEIDRGVTLVGPHRDDMIASLGSLPAKGYASHGESWSYALALRLAAWKLLTEDESGEWNDDGEPLLILDDVFAELDARRRRRLAEIVSEAEQVFVTAAVGDDLPEELASRQYSVHQGSVDLL